jgi:chromosome segregation protein
MFIREIEINNFKSFSDVTVIPFLQGFTTISGPNGSGKSNIIDSILFALGLSSSRTLRAEKLPDLINNHGKKNEASVKISFYDEHTSTDLTVARKIKRTPSGYTSTYYLRDKVSTLTEVHDTLSRFNVSPGCYNVMMQGDVTGIINMSPNERRKIIDEIAGVAEFDRRIEQAKNELLTVDERVEKSNIIVKEIDTRLVQLETEKDQALKYQKLKQEKQELEGKLDVIKYFEMKNSLERLHESIIETNKTSKEEKIKLQSAINELAEYELKLSEINSLIKSKGEDEQLEIKKQAETLKGVIARKKESINFIDRQINENKNHVNTAKTNIEKLKERIEAAVYKIENRQDEITRIEENISSEKAEMQRVLSEVSAINQTADANLEQRNELRKNLENTKDKQNEILKRKIAFGEKTARYKRDLDEAQALIATIESEKENYSQQKDLLKVQIQEISKELQDYEIIQKNCLYELDKTKNELIDINHNIGMAQRKVYQFEAEKRANENQNQDRAINTIMNAGLSGIHSSLAQLGKVNKEYSEALEKAIGGRMRNIVVDDDSVASKAIQVLKSTRAGVLTFLPLNKIRPMPKGLRAPNIEGIIDYAVNLIDFDPMYSAAFYYALGETVIVEDMASARKLIGKFRMVTLDGSILEKTGAMTGGDSGRSSGLKFAQNQDEELERFKTRLAEFERKSISFEQQKQQLETKLDKVRQDYSLAMNELNRKKVQYDNFDRNIQEKETTLTLKKQLIEDTTPLLEEIQGQFDKVCLELVKIDQTIEELTQAIKEIEAIIPKDELSKLNNLTESIELEIKKYESKLANCHNEIKALKMEINFNREQILAHEENSERKSKDSESISKEKAVHQQDIIETEEKLKALNLKITELGSKLIELQDERSKLNSEFFSLEKRKGSIETKLERLEEQVISFKSRRKTLEFELTAIKEEVVAKGHDITKINISDISVDQVNRNISGLQRKMEALEPVNMRALTDYDEVQTRRTELQDKIDTLSLEKCQIIERMSGYEEMKLKSFRDTFNVINTNFKDIFAGICDGTGNLVLEDSEKLFNGGLTIEAQPRDKKRQRLESMSGGEKSITALAFVFALQRFMPAPFYAFDEVDMHLDGINAERLAQMVKLQSASTQFIVVSLRKPMIEAADRTVGVTQKNNGITKVTGVILHA